MSAREVIEDFLAAIGTPWPGTRADAIIANLRGADAATRLALIRDLMPETHAVVPKRPTQAMWRAAPTTGDDLYRNIYRAMLAAAQEGVSDAG
jgi:hypothetical protein